MTDIVSPIDEQPVYTYRELSEAEALRRLTKAQEVQHEWVRVPLEERVAICRRMLERYAEFEDEYAEQISRMMGKPIGQARGEFRGPMRERTLYLCDLAAEALADDAPPDKSGFRRFVRREPVGTVLDIAAWNYPLIIAINVVVLPIPEGARKQPLAPGV